MNITAQERAERLFKREAEKKTAMTEYRAQQEAVRARTARLRAERLAREKKVEKTSK
jgi:hypothetical protein